MHSMIRFAAIAAFLMVWFAFGMASAGENAEKKTGELTVTEHRILHEAQKAMAEKRYEDAEQLLADHIRSHPGGVHYLVEFNLGTALAMRGELEAALIHYRTAASIHPGGAAVWRNMGSALYHLKRYAEAGKSLARAHSLARDRNPETGYQAAVAYVLAGRPADARPLLEEAVSAVYGQPSAEWLETLLNVYIGLKQQSLALELVRKMLRTSGGHPPYWKILASLYIDGKEYRKAAAALETAAALTTPGADDIRLLGDLYRMAQIPLKAAREYERLLAEEPKPADMERAASAYIAARHPEKAIEWLTRGIIPNPSNGMLWLLADAYYGIADYDNAYRAYGRCALERKKKGRACLMMGYCALQAHRLEDAKDAFSKAARFSVHQKEAGKLLAEIERRRQWLAAGQKSEEKK